MPADVVVGLQWGSEGKGKVAAALAEHYHAAVRVGAPNAGHSVYVDGKCYKMRQIPCAWTNPKCRLYVGAAGLINPDVLKEEFEMFDDPARIQGRFFIDRNAGLVLEEDIRRETQTGLFQAIGSTTEGIGSALARKVLRQGAKTARDYPDLERYVTNVMRELYTLLDTGHCVQFEGTQGFGLCLNHTPEYPFATSRDVLAASILSDSGVAPKWLRHVFGVLRTYPIRVFGNSGPMLAPEITWEEVAKRSGYAELNERTTVTKRVRRVSEFSWGLVDDAVRANGPTGIFITFIDYFDHRLRGAKTMLELSTCQAAMDFVIKVERMLQVPVLGISTGPLTDDMIWTRAGESVLEELKTSSMLARTV